MWSAVPLLFFLATDFTAEGMKALEDRKYQEAAGLFAKAVAADPGDYAANFHLALSYSLLDRPAERDRTAAAAQLGRAHAQARQKRLPDASEHFRQAAALDASYKDGLLELASLLEANKQPEEAIAIYQQFPDNSVAQGRLGELL